MKILEIYSKETGIIKAELYESKCPKTVEKIWNNLPLKVELSRWGDELYGTIPIKIDPENPKEECEVGDLAYWLDGSGFCILFGPTPVSTSNKPRLISPGNIFGHIIGDPLIFKKFTSLEIELRKG
ncbi:MAG: cyclophilin-like fold protein [Promethearchaeota archaeon]